MAIEDVRVEGDSDAARAVVTAFVALRSDRAQEAATAEETYVIEFRHGDSWTVVSVRNPSEFDPDGQNDSQPFRRGLG